MFSDSKGWRGLFSKHSGDRRRLLKGAIAMLIVMSTGFVFLPVSPTSLNLKDLSSTATANVVQHWHNGDLVVLIRHAERCDRSRNPCLGPADGITQFGSIESQKLGHAYTQMGMSHTDVLSSPITRTAQTAQYMFDKPTLSEQWLADCGKTMLNDVLVHKQAGRNLMLVTHSGCISDFEKQTGFNHAATSEYDSSLFVWVTPDGAVKVLGIANMPDWPMDTSLRVKR